MRSQDTTDLRPVCFPFWMAQEMALDLAEKSRLQARERLAQLELSAYRSMVTGLEQNRDRRMLQLEILQRNKQLLETQLKLYQPSRKKDMGLGLLLRLLGAFGIGYFLGSL